MYIYCVLRCVQIYTPINITLIKYVSDRSAGYIYPFIIILLYIENVVFATACLIHFFLFILYFMSNFK